MTAWWAVSTNRPVGEPDRRLLNQVSAHRVSRTSSVPSADRTLRGLIEQRYSPSIDPSQS